MAARSTSVLVDGVQVIASGVASSVAAHQIALQLWLLCSFLCDALAMASQALVADGTGQRDVGAIRSVSKTVFQWGLVSALSLLLILWVERPLNAFVFEDDGVLQGAEEFPYQAKAMALSVVTAMSVFAILKYPAIGRGSILAEPEGRYAGSCLVWVSSLAIDEWSHFVCKACG